jgi:acetyl esterase/lipase
MKIERKMIDKQLRIPGMIFNLIMKTPCEARFRQLRIKSDRLHGKKIRGLECSEDWITRKQDGTRLRICIYRPLASSTCMAGILWMHGGGYAIGAPESSAGIIKRFIAEHDCVVIAPDYRLSLDSPYPAALDDCHEALLWMKKQAGVLGIRDDQLMVGGESAGGGLAIALALYEKDHGGVKIAFQMPLYPMIDDRMTSESAKGNNAPVWNSDANRVAWGLYLGGLAGKDVPPYAAPARAINYDNLPPAVTFVGDLEPFRDETVQYVSNLRDAGVHVDFELYPGCYHAFDKMNPYADVSRSALSFLMKSFTYAVEHYFAQQST